MKIIEIRVNFKDYDGKNLGPYSFFYQPRTGDILDEDKKQIGKCTTTIHRAIDRIRNEMGHEILEVISPNTGEKETQRDFGLTA